MHKSTKPLGVGILVATVFHCLPGIHADELRPHMVTGNVNWVYSYAEGQRLARVNKKPLFVVFRCER